MSAPATTAREYGKAERDAMASKGQALPDGSFPIADEADLRAAISSYGRAADRAAAKAHITKRAKALGKTDLLPADWAGSTKQASGPDADDLHVDTFVKPAKAKKKLPPGQMPPGLNTYLQKLKELLKGTVPGPVFDDAVKKARGHAGGKASAAAKKQAQEDDQPTGCMIGYFLKPDEAAALAMDGGEAPEDLHLTLAYLGSVDDLPDDVAERATAAISALAYAISPIQIESTGVDRFEAEDTGSLKDVIYATVDDAGGEDDDADAGMFGDWDLDDLRARVCQALAAVGLKPRSDHGEYVPHITLAYVDPDSEITVTLPDVDMVLDTLTVAIAGKRNDYPITGRSAADVWDMMPATMREPLRLAEFIEPPLTIPVLPRPGTYTHPAYGELDMTPERIAAFVANFGIYQDRIPIDLEHQTKLSGAAGWITGLMANADGSVDASVEWTDMGADALRKDRYLYVSPEWYEEWTRPVDGAQYENVLIGAALTTRPFFKPPDLRSLAASEDVGAADARAPQGTPTPREVSMADEKKADSAKAADPKSVTLTEEQAKQFAEMQTQLAELTAAKTAAEQLAATQGEALKAASETIGAMQDQAQTKRFTDEVMGKSDASDLRWFGEPEQHVTILKHLAKTAGEDSDIFKAYVTQQRALAEQMRSSKLFDEIGTGAGGSSAADPQSQINALAQKRASEKGINIGEATRQIMNEQPDLARRAGESARVKV